jgi:S-formylglutathione hydrolase FrmB
LDSLDIVDVHKSEIGKTGLYGDDELEWGVKVNYRNVYCENGRSDDLFSASGYIGDVYFVGKNTWLQYGLKGGLRKYVAENGSVFIAPTLNLTTQLNSKVRLLLSVGHEFGFYRATDQGSNVKFTGTSQLNRISAISATYEKDLYGRTLSVGYNHYF